MKLQIILFGLAHALCFGAVRAQVVADSACEKYAVDIAAFATCDSPTRVARAEAGEDTAITPRPAEQKAPEKQASKERDDAKKKAPLKPPARKR